ncbi:DUF4139 domain-containing protein [Sphingosinicella terrae]|uniref:DUF4139 domain-containing protein n=1 Tax=Sphingosinicella terrae TaxID=2172047 RepID=UPI000E0CEBA9|nr:hypothetical protein [Sphingosinicella terrae]
MRALTSLAWAAALAGAAPAASQTLVTSPRPDSVDVTVYRAPGRDPSTAMELDLLQGYALIAETRRVSLPAGETELRFEGVAGGIVPQSAVLSGFPERIVERNRDAYLLSPASLLERSLGRHVRIRRTSRATGAVREHPAVIRSGADGAVVLQTADGYEALQCTGMTEQLVYPSVPPGLSASPTLSVRARSTQAVSATITLTYLASGFDWQADYIATLAPDGRTLDLFAWLTLASNDETSFPDADTQAVAGRLNREAVERERGDDGALRLRCWPSARTSDIPADAPPARRQRALAAARFDSVAPVTVIGAEDVVVTGARMARQEELGDLKLYRLPEPVTVAANGQKQVAFLHQPQVAFDLVYRQRLAAGSDYDALQAQRMLVTRNRPEQGLGLPLPGGSLQLFAAAGGRPILVGQGALADRAVGEEVEIQIGEAAGVVTRVETIEFGDDWADYRVTVTSDQQEPVRFEAEFNVGQDERFRPRTRLARRDGRPLWAVTIPANGSAELRYRISERGR